MASADFSLREQDKARLIKDRLIRYIVTAGGVGVFGALMLIFFYLASIAIPLFSSAELKLKVEVPYEFNRSTESQITSPFSIGMNESMTHAYVLNSDGRLDSIELASSYRSPVVSLVDEPTAFTQTNDANPWLVLSGQNGHISIFQLNLSLLSQAALSNSSETMVPIGISIPLFNEGNPIRALSLSVVDQTATLIGIDHLQQLSAFALQISGGDELLSAQEALNSRAIDLPANIGEVSEALLTPDGQTLYVRQAHELVILKRSGNTFFEREKVILSSDSQSGIKSIQLLSGGDSLLVVHENDTVSQWFDVIENKRRSLTRIREFHLSPGVDFINPERYGKGFYSFHEDGVVENTYTTNSSLQLSEQLLVKPPLVATMTMSESGLILATDDGLSVYAVDNAYPEISFSSLWQKIWYENYSEPEYVWQTTSADDAFEPKFSLTPIIFGTLKAAFFAMLFSVPIAVFGAIYTAYFMSEKMRRVVKPTIELMEALPTVIIGFLAGLWFAPIVEQNLSALLALLFLLPLSILVVGGIWSVLPKPWITNLPSGWHSIILIPILALIVFVVFKQSVVLEQWWFDGDARLFLSDYGIDFDQRNALVVGFAMGFAVIPTIFTIAEDAIFSVPKHLSDGALALGATSWQALTSVVLITATPGIFSAVMMGLGRAVGETMIVLMATGNTPIMDWNIFEGMRSLSATLAVELPESEVGSTHYRLLFFAALILFSFTFAVNSLAEWVRQRLRDRYRAL